MEPADQAAAAGSVVGVLFVYVVIGVIYAIIVYIIARKRRLNPWPWTIGALIPAIGLLVSGIFYLLTFLSMLDRLNALEDKATFS